MYKVWLLLSLVAVCLAGDRELFHDFLVKYQKNYVGEPEYETRFEIFQENLRHIERENAKNNGVKLGITPFADLTNEEFRAMKKGNSFAHATLPKKESLSFKALPTNFNWVNHGVVGPVMEEGECGSSYLFTVVESIESVYAIAQNKSYIPLSIDQVEACSGSGCNGADSQEILDYIQAHGVGFENGTCPKGTVEDGVCIKGSSCVPSGNEDAMAAALIAQGPLFIGIDGGDQSFQLYTSGVYSSSSCSSTQLDTSLLLVGFNQNAWICQNQWGVDWGMNGYIWIARNANNMCGVATASCYPTGVSKC